MPVFLQKFNDAIMASLKVTKFKGKEVPDLPSDILIKTHWPHFSRSELQCHCGCSKMLMDDGFMKKLEELRKAFGKPMRVSSAYRCATHNAKVSKTGRNGPHTTGQAVDILVSGEDAYELLYYAVGFGFGGLGVSQRGPHANRFIHLDRLESLSSRPRPRVWSY